ncbi:MAG: DNA replication/repair protein RecF [Butyribacter sp.]|nr:DNA replication/repair protein RecF [bacterium]MDY3854655.1 DNA replication/repair protein RecF [Butyribacter sp.]
MYINSLEVGNFRNYEFGKIEFHDKTNILYGDNAQGKTNLLESIFVCGTTKSHKGSKDRELIRLGQEEAHIRMHLTKKNIKHRIDMHLKKNKGKGIAIDGIPIRRSSELLGLLNVIFFSPEDLRIIKNGPSERRKFINMELCQLDSVYLHDLSEYNKVLMQRNKLLKQIYYQPSLKDTLEIWDMQLIEYGKKIIERRNSFVEEISEIVTAVNEKLTGSKEHIKMIYEPDVKIDEFEKKLKNAYEKDLKSCSTSVGPHRDDLCFMNGTIDIRKYGSQGQQRTCALSLKLAEIELVKKTIGDSPILLLDDVLSELDRNRQNYLLDSIDDIQTIITCTGIEEFIDSRLTLNKIFRITDGKIAVEK